MWVWSLGQEDLQEKEMTTHSSILAWIISWTEEPGDWTHTWRESGLESWSCHLVDGTKATACFPLKFCFLICKMGILTSTLRSCYEGKTVPRKGNGICWVPVHAGLVLALNQQLPPEGPTAEVYCDWVCWWDTQRVHTAVLLRARLCSAEGSIAWMTAVAQLRHEPPSPVLLTGGLILTNGPVFSGPVTHALSEGAGHCSRHQPKRGGEEHFLGCPVPVGFFFFFERGSTQYHTELLISTTKALRSNI